MLEMSKYTNTKAVADNEILINGVSFGKVTNTVAEQIISIINGSKSVSKEVSTELHIEEEKSDKFSTFKLKGKSIYEDDATTVIQNGRKYMVTIHIPTFWGKKDTKTKEEHKRKRDWIKDGYKLVAKNHLKATYEGNYDCGDIHWTFPNKKSAEEYIQICKDGKVMEVAKAYRPKYN